MPRSCHLKRSGKKTKKWGHLKCTGTLSRCRVCHPFKFFISFRAFRSPTHTLSPTRSIFHSSTKAARVSSPPTSGIQSFRGGCIEVPRSEKPVWLRFVLGWLSRRLRAVGLHYVNVCICMCMSKSGCTYLNLLICCIQPETLLPTMSYGLYF